MEPLLEFYRGHQPDHRGRLLAEILQQDDDWLEFTHDYIQWLFPNREPSGVLPVAPLITPVIEKAFCEDPALRQQLRVCFYRLLAFYGLTDTGAEIERAGNWPLRMHGWFTSNTHNSLRITRILNCLMALGLRDEAEKFYRALLCLRDSERDCGITPRTVVFWRAAVEL